MRHNLVSVLYTVKGFIETHLMRSEEGRFDSKEEALEHAQAAMKKVYAQTQKALLITKKLGLAMKALPKSAEELDQISIKEIWKEVSEMLKRQRSKSGNIEIIDHISNEFPDILCDKNDLIEILYCLADNAAQAMSDARKEELSDKDEKGKLIIRASLGFHAREIPVANIAIADTGPGIPEEILNRLFEPFMTTKASHAGNGLGLCIVNALVRRNNGNISVSSFKGCGTTFTLTFPVAKASRHQENFAAVS